MDDGEFAIPGDCHTHYACHYLVWGQGSSWYLRTIDGNRGIFWAVGWDYRQGDLQVILELATGVVTPLMISFPQGPRTFRHVCGMPARRSVHHARDIRISRRCCRSQVKEELAY